MDLHSGIPFWLVKNGLLADYPALETDLLQEEVVIIGSGISGALAAYELGKVGFRCTMLDKRLLSSGSTWASTAQLNYEIDASLTDLKDLYSESFAVAVYEASLASVHKIQQIAANTALNECLEAKPSLYLSSDKKGARAIEKECELRRKHNFPVEFLEKEQLLQFRITNRTNALYHQHAVQLDAYRMTAGLIQHQVKKGDLSVYTRTAVTHVQPEANAVILRTDKGHIIRARFVICAPGYESAQFLPKQVMELNSTYALVTQPLPEAAFWKERCLIWESKRPYFYLRTTKDNRIMMGGEDVPFKSEAARDRLIDKKAALLLKDCKELFPHLDITADFVWCGTFGEVKDGLPFIGLYPGINNVYFALGYGGNGTTYSVIAAEVICNLLKGKPDHRAQLFGFDRSKAS
jgi:glycine/D-amino acid oxidase-like deaminating enzyme